MPFLRRNSTEKSSRTSTREYKPSRCLLRRTTSAQSSTVTIVLHAASRASFMHVRETGERHGAVRGPHAPADRGRRYVHTTSETLTWALRQVPSQVHATKMLDGSTPPHLSFLLTYHTHTRTHQATSRVYVAEKSDGPATSRTPHPPLFALFAFTTRLPWLLPPAPTLDRAASC